MTKSEREAKKSWEMDEKRGKRKRKEEEKIAEAGT